MAIKKSKPLPNDRVFDAIVHAYEEQRDDYQRLQDLVEGSLRMLKRVCPDVHSYGARMKDPMHLRDKLKRRAEERAKSGKAFDVTPLNFHKKINDLVGGRVLHLHVNQFPAIHEALKKVFEKSGHKIIHGGPEAKVWDPEYKKLFQGLKIRCVAKLSLYTSVHYEFEAPGKLPRLTWELQVRTLAEELWGETDHLINYPHKCTNDSCREQILVLARATSTCTRLVDSIMTTFHAGKPKKA